MVLAPLTVDGVPVYTNAGLAIRYNVETNVVYDENFDPVIDNMAYAPITYEPESGTFASIGGARPFVTTQKGSKYLTDKGYTLGTVSVDDEYYMVKITNRRSGEINTAYATRVPIRLSFWDAVTSGVSGVLLNSYDYFNMTGVRYDRSLYDIETVQRAFVSEFLKTYFGFAGAGFDKVLGNLLTVMSFGYNPSMGTVEELFRDILVEGGPYDSDTVLKTSEGNYVYDDFGTVVSVVNGQLVDGLGFPLISATDYFPVYLYDEKYVSTSGAELSFVFETDRFFLVDSDGAKVHSVLEEILEEKRKDIYFPYLRKNTFYPGQVQIPAVGKKNAAGDDLDYTTLNGVDINSDLTWPNLSKASYNAHNPDDPFEEKNWFDQVVELLKVVGIVLLAVIGVIVALWLLSLLVRVVKRLSGG
ncbi:hypothetical protein FACS1894211_02480 [Clostridia bacterium]|nr:hypothetical protein FACS1894211_02480 [Clostridia bacterium]